MGSHCAMRIAAAGSNHAAAPLGHIDAGLQTFEQDVCLVVAGRAATDAGLHRLATTNDFATMTGFKSYTILQSLTARGDDDDCCCCVRQLSSVPPRSPLPGLLDQCETPIQRHF